MSRSRFLLPLILAPLLGACLQNTTPADNKFLGGQVPPTVPELVVFTDLPPDSLHFARWTLIDAAIEGDVLNLRVGFSGCEPEQPWTFYICGGFMESWPIQVNGVLVHELYEVCGAYWEVTLQFDLLPLEQAYLEAYGTGEVLILNLIDFEGVSHPLEYFIDANTATAIGDLGD